MKVMSDKLKKVFEGHRLEILAISICILLSASVIVYALTYLWTGFAGATITTEVQNIVVLDAQGNEVTSINFGNVNPGSTVRIKLYIKNTSPNATIRITWTSTLSTVTNKITDQWVDRDGYNLSVRVLSPGYSLETYYVITVAADCPLQSYSWTLYIVPG